jgi:hypothetical protein
MTRANARRDLGRRALPYTFGGCVSDPRLLQDEYQMKACGAKAVCATKQALVGYTPNRKAYISTRR